MTEKRSVRPDWKRASIVGFVSIMVLVFLDQFSKYVAVLKLKGSEPFVLLNGVFELHYLENQGAAFGLMQGKKTLFVITTVLILCILVFIYFKLPSTKRYLPVNWIVIFFVAGAIGNFIDRVRQDCVVDFFYFKLIDFPIFNVADIYVTVAAFFVIILGLFYYKEADYELIFPSKSKKEKDITNE